MIPYLGTLTRATKFKRLPSSNVQLPDVDPEQEIETKLLYVRSSYFLSS